MKKILERIGGCHDAPNTKASVSHDNITSDLGANEK
jgi:hypothetical protein